MVCCQNIQEIWSRHLFGDIEIDYHDIFFQPKIHKEARNRFIKPSWILWEEANNGAPENWWRIRFLLGAYAKPWGCTSSLKHLYESHTTTVTSVSSCHAQPVGPFRRYPPQRSNSQWLEAVVPPTSPCNEWRFCNGISCALNHWKFKGYGMCGILEPFPQTSIH